MVRLDKGDRRVLVGHAFTAENQFVRRKLRTFTPLIRIPFIRLVIEDDQRAAGIGVIKQLLVGGDQFRFRFIHSIVDDD